MPRILQVFIFVLVLLSATMIVVVTITGDFSPFRVAVNMTLSRSSSVTSNKLTCVFNDTNKGRIPVLESIDPPDTKRDNKFSHVHLGGTWMPDNCRAKQKVAVIVCYRDRPRELNVFLKHMHPFLQRQELDYRIYVIEQAAGAPFNRGMMFNVGFLEASSREDYDCFILHDVDVLPEDDRILYTCADHPRHLSAACSKWNYRLPYKTIFGGVTAFTPRQFQRINGFSNGYFGWGGEDDDLYHRAKRRGYKILRYPLTISRYKMLKHDKQPPNERRTGYLINWEHRADKDGLNSAMYSVEKYEETRLKTQILVEVNQTAIMQYIDLFMPKRINQLRKL